MAHSTPTRKLPLILLAEDQADDVFFMECALDKSGVSADLITVKDGQEAVDYLDGVGQYADRATYPLPSLLLLDINMPRMNGFDVLSWLYIRLDFKTLPVVMLSSSDLDSDMEKAKDMGADDYRVKPNATDQLIPLIQELHSRWLSAQSKMAEIST